MVVDTKPTLCWSGWGPDGKLLIMIELTTVEAARMWYKYVMAASKHVAIECQFCRKTDIQYRGTVELVFKFNECDYSVAHRIFAGR